jgi:spore maturation protein SpmA
MALNFIWIAFSLSHSSLLYKLLIEGDTEIFKNIVDGVFDSTKTVDISIGLIGVLSLFLGFMNVGKRQGQLIFFRGLWTVLQ